MKPNDKEKIKSSTTKIFRKNIQITERQIRTLSTTKKSMHFYLKQKMFKSAI